jgi:hypothetical protein
MHLHIFFFEIFVCTRGLWLHHISIISTNNIARGMVRDHRKYAFNPPKIRFCPGSFCRPSLFLSSLSALESVHKTYDRSKSMLEPYTIPCLIPGSERDTL